MNPDPLIIFSTIIAKPIPHWNHRDRADYSKWKLDRERVRCSPMRFRILTDQFPAIETVRDGELITGAHEAYE